MTTDRAGIVEIETCDQLLATSQAYADGARARRASVIGNVNE